MDAGLGGLFPHFLGEGLGGRILGTEAGWQAEAEVEERVGPHFVGLHGPVDLGVGKVSEAHLFNGHLAGRVEGFLGGFLSRLPGQYPAGVSLFQDPVLDLAVADRGAVGEGEGDHATGVTGNPSPSFTVEITLRSSAFVTLRFSHRAVLQVGLVASLEIRYK